jgi:hypothetical protein
MGKSGHSSNRHKFSSQGVSKTSSNMAKGKEKDGGLRKDTKGGEGTSYGFSKEVEDGGGEEKTWLAISELLQHVKGLQHEIAQLKHQRGENGVKTAKEKSSSERRWWKVVRRGRGWWPAVKGVLEVVTLVGQRLIPWSMVGWLLVSHARFFPLLVSHL